MNFLSKARTDGKKIYCKSGLEEDCTSWFGRRYYCYVRNIPGIKSFAKNQMNRRMRRFSRQLELHEYRENNPIFYGWYDEEQEYTQEYWDAIDEMKNADQYRMYIWSMCQPLLAQKRISWQQMQSLLEMGESPDPENIEMVKLILVNLTESNTTVV
jgi:hypothetical protein